MRVGGDSAYCGIYFTSRERQDGGYTGDGGGCGGGGVDPANTRRYPGRSIVMKCGDNLGYFVVSFIRYIPFLLLFPYFCLTYN